MPRADGPNLGWVDPFDCETVCRRKGEWNDIERASRGCHRPDLPEVQWDVSVTKLRHYHGRARALELQADPTIDWEHPTEDPDEGCPGAWRIGPWVWSVVRYARRTTETGARVPNPYHDQLDANANPRLVAAVAYYEHEVDCAIAHRKAKAHEHTMARMKEK